jgi:rubrerythrin
MKNILFMLLISLIASTSCNQAKPLKTIEDLKAGIKEESTESTKYASFAQKARLEGKVSIANLFDAASKAEAIHAANHRKVLESLGEKMESFTPQFEVKTTEENLRAAIDGESYEVVSMYPLFLSDARSENVTKAKKSFTWAYNTEKKHQQLYIKSLEALKKRTENSLPVSYAICPVCGNTYEVNTIDKRCAFCQTRKDKFIEI